MTTLLYPIRVISSLKTVLDRCWDKTALKKYANDRNQKHKSEFYHARHVARHKHLGGDTVQAALYKNSNCAMARFFCFKCTSRVVVPF